MATEEQPRYSIGELSDLGGVNRRTVRYYVQRGLLPPPLGAGRGSYYSQQHLDTLIRIRQWQERGISLDEIEARLAGRPVAKVRASNLEPRYSHWTRVELLDGVELHLRNRRLDSHQIRSLADAIHRVLQQGEGP